MMIDIKPDEFLQFVEAVKSLDLRSLLQKIDHEKVREEWMKANGDGLSPDEDAFFKELAMEYQKKANLQAMKAPSFGEFCEELDFNLQYNKFFSKLDNQWYEHHAHLIPDLLNTVAEAIQNRSLALGGGYTILEQASCIIRSQHQEVKRLNKTLADYKDALEKAESRIQWLKNRKPHDEQTQRPLPCSTAP